MSRDRYRQLTVRLDAEDVAEVRSLAAALRIPVGAFLRTLVIEGLTVMERRRDNARAILESGSSR